MGEREAGGPNIRAHARAATREGNLDIAAAPIQVDTGLGKRGEKGKDSEPQRVVGLGADHAAEDKDEVVDDAVEGGVKAGKQLEIMDSPGKGSTTAKPPPTFG